MEVTHILFSLKNNVQVFSRYLSADLYLFYLQVTVVPRRKQFKTS